MRDTDLAALGPPAGGRVRPLARDTAAEAPAPAGLAPGTVVPAGSRPSDDPDLRAGPRFDRRVGHDGYAWWYVDAFSEDQACGLTLIAFIGSVFSPYYATARRAGPADPTEHVAFNVALYGRGGKRWTMTERSHRALRRSATELAVGPSELHWDGQCLRVRLDERTAVFPSAVRGEIRVYPEAVGQQVFTLDGGGAHRWWPIAPRATVEVDLPEPGRRWRGLGYLDCNHGDAPLERDFVAWDWSRTMKQSGATVFYDVARRDGAAVGLALEFDAAGRALPVAAPPVAALRRTFWGLPRRTRSDAGTRAAVVSTLEDGPFYARSVVSASVHGEPVTAMHESLSLDRFRARWVQGLLPYRMPRDPA